MNRHRWCKLRLHVYICRKCGAGKRNETDNHGEWFTTYFLPNGETVRGPRAVPACERGPKSETYLAKYAEFLDIPF